MTNLLVVDLREGTSVARPVRGVASGFYPLSVAHNPMDNRLYALDARAVGQSLEVRLLRVAPDGAASELGLIPQLSRRTELHVSARPDGLLLLSAGGAASERVAHLLLDVSGEQFSIVSSFFETRPGRLLAPPVANGAAGPVTLIQPMVGYGDPAPGEGDWGRFADAPAGRGAGRSGDQAAGWLATSGEMDTCVPWATPATEPCVALGSVALFASHELKVDDGVRILGASGGYGAVASAGTLTTRVAPDAWLGALWSRSNVSLADRVKVFGGLRTAGNSTAGNGVQVSGGTQQRAAVNLAQLADFTLLFPQSHLGTVFLGPGQSATRAPGPYGNVTLHQNANLTLASGVYSFESLTLEAGSRITLSTGAGPVYIYVESAMTLRGSLVQPSGAGNRLLIGYFGTQAASVERAFRGTIVAPRANLELKSVSTPWYRGSFFAKRLQVHPHNRVTHDPFAFPWVP